MPTRQDACVRHASKVESALIEAGDGLYGDMGEGTGARALVVDDAAEFRELVTMVLRREGFVVEAAADGPEALAAARGFAPDVVVLDIGLPGMDGVEVCRRLRTFTDAYVVMLTGRQEEVDKL